MTPRSLAAAGITLAALFALSACGGEDEPIPVPDVVGMPGDEARDALEELDLGHTFEAEEGSVWSPGNWVVESTDPAAEAELESGDEVLINLVRPIEDEPEEDEPESAEEEEAEESAEETPEAIEQFEVDHDADDLGGLVPGGTTFVRFDIDDNFTQGLIASAAQRATCDAIEEGLEAEPETGRVAIEGSFPTMDEFGNEENSVILRAHYDAATIDRIDFSNCYIIDVWDLRDGGQIHPDLLANR